MDLGSTTEKVFMLMTKDDGRASFGEFRDLAVRAAVVADLAEAGLVTFGEGKDPEARLAPGARADDPMLAQALSVIAAKPRRISTLLTGGTLKPEPAVVARLAAAGVIGVEPKRLAGLIGPRYPTLDPGPENRLRGHLNEVMLGRVAANPSDAAALAILDGVGAGQPAWGDIAPRLSKRERKARIKEIAAGSTLGDSVRRAVENLTAAVMVAAAVAAGAAATAT